MEFPTDQHPRIVPIRIARQAFAWTFGGFDTLLRLGWAAALVITALGAMIEPVIVDIEPQNQEQLQAAPGLLMGLLLLALVTVALTSIVLIAWQRTLLQPDGEPPRRIHLRIGRRELVYTLIVFFLLGLASMGLVTAPGAFQAFAAGQPMPGLFMLIGPVLALLLVARVVMVLPAVALDRPADLGRTWRATQGNVVRIATVLLLVGLPLFLGQLLLMEMSAAVLSADLGLIVVLLLRFVVALLSFVLAAPAAAAVALLYVLLVDRDLARILPQPFEAYCDGWR